jgi:hypothetical protein
MAEGDWVLERGMFCCNNDKHVTKYHLPVAKNVRNVK